MKTDSELLDLAAKAGGRLKPHGNTKLATPNERLIHDQTGSWFWPKGDDWDPLKDDGDALRLSVKLGIAIEFGFNRDGSVYGVHTDDELKIYERVDDNNGCPYAATRRVIVRAAAEIGES